MIVQTIYNNDSCFCMPEFSGNSDIAYIYNASVEEVRTLIAGWPYLEVRTRNLIKDASPSEDDYALPDGRMRLYLDLVATFGEPTHVTSL